MNKKQRLVIIGGGLSAIALVEELLKLDAGNLDITMFGAERHGTYNRVLLSQVLTGEKTLNDIMLHDKAWFRAQGIDFRAGAKVKEIKRRGRVVVAEDGSETSYDRAVIATGALPYMPKIIGIGKRGVVSFRNIDDCNSIREIAGKDAKAIVLGGGILGLEAAYALNAMGLKVTIVHIADRLMERQLDGAAAGFLRQALESLGIGVLLGKEAVEVLGDERAMGIKFKDDAVEEAGLIVVSTGIVPNTALASASGIYCEKGIVVSDTMQTYDPAVYAIGECTEHRGRCFGLVGPVFEQARVLADHIAGQSRLIFRPSPQSARLKIPGIELFSAGNIDEGAHVESIEYIDRALRIYKKILVSKNAVRGIILYGDTASAPELFSLLAGKEDISEKRRTLLFQQATSGAGGIDVDAMPDSAIICGCNGITKGAIKDAIRDKGLFSVEEVKAETKAASSCGGCLKLVEAILEASLGANFQGINRTARICPCTQYSREDIIKNIKELGLKSVVEVMGWEKVGCDVCRPAINYYLLMANPHGAVDDSSSRLVNERMHANIQNDNTFSVVPRLYGGVISTKELKKIAEVSEKYGARLVKITGGQRIALIGIKKEDLASVWKDLGLNSGYAYGKALRTVKTCVGDSYCRYGTQDSLGLGIEMEKKFEGLWMPAKLKLSVSGCPRNCSESSIKDIGIVGITGAWDIFVGGCGGIELKAGERLATVKTKEEAMDIVAAFIQLYREEAEYGERTFKWVGRTGINSIKNIILDEKTRSGLIARLNQAAGAVKEPWKERVERTASLHGIGS